MAKKCAITGKDSLMVGNYSNKVRATQYNPTGKTRSKANIQKKKIFIPEVGKSIRLWISTKGIKTIQKNGAYVTLKKAGLI